MRAPESRAAAARRLICVSATSASLIPTREKKLTGWAAIIAVPTAVTGFYGQNVEYPGINTVTGFIASTVVIVSMVALLYVMFKRRDWL